jgi:hypothetical protein
MTAEFINFVNEIASKIRNIKITHLNEEKDLYTVYKKPAGAIIFKFLKLISNYTTSNLKYHNSNVFSFVCSENAAENYRDIVIKIHDYVVKNNNFDEFYNALKEKFNEFLFEEKIFIENIQNEMIERLKENTVYQETIIRKDKVEKRKIIQERPVSKNKGDVVKNSMKIVITNQLAALGVTRHSNFEVDCTGRKKLGLQKYTKEQIEQRHKVISNIFEYMRTSVDYKNNSIAEVAKFIGYSVNTLYGPLK